MYIQVNYAPSEDGYTLHTDWVEMGVIRFVDEGGRKVLVCHGDEEGLVTAPDRYMNWADIVICCHPAQVQERQGITTLGRWEGVTEIRFFPNFIQVCQAGAYTM